MSTTAQRYRHPEKSGTHPPKPEVHNVDDFRGDAV